MDSKHLGQVKATQVKTVRATLRTTGRAKQLVAAVLALAVLASAGPALSQGWGRPGGGPGKGAGPGPGPGPGGPMPARQWGQGRSEGPPPHRPGERMSPEERRDLRRDIEQHGREIYPDPRRGPPR